MSFDEDPERIHEGKWQPVHFSTKGTFPVPEFYDTKREADELIRFWLEYSNAVVARQGHTTVKCYKTGAPLFTYPSEFLMLIPMPVKGV